MKLPGLVASVLIRLKGWWRPASSSANNWLPALPGRFAVPIWRAGPFEMWSSGFVEQTDSFSQGVVREINPNYSLQMKEMTMPGIMSEGSKVSSAPNCAGWRESRSQRLGARLRIELKGVRAY